MSFDFAWHPQAWVLLAPILILGAGALIIMVADLFIPRMSWTYPAVVVIAIAISFAIGRWNHPLPEVEAALGGAIRMDNLAVFLQVLLLSGCALSLLISKSYNAFLPQRRAEFVTLVLFAAMGMSILVASGDLITLFLGLELLSFPTYVLCGWLREQIKSNEAALKYFVLGSFASSIFLYGVALIWGATGTTSIAALQVAPDDPLFILGSILVLVGFLFKIGVVPFHMWVPDVYEGAPIPVTSLMATAVKVAAVGALYRVVVGGLLRDAIPYADIFWWLAVASMTLGNLSALTQDNIKRLLAFSSVAHAGYMLIGLTAVAKSGSPAGGGAILYYLVAYTFMNLGAFAVVTLLSRKAEVGLQFDRDWRGIARRFPVLGMAMSIFMLSLGGLPPLAGFFGKYSIFAAAIDAGLTSLVVIAVVNSAVSVYFYLRVIVAMYMKSEREPATQALSSFVGRTEALEGPGAMSVREGRELVPPRLADYGGGAAHVVILICVLVTLWLGMGPSLGKFPGVAEVMNWAQAAVSEMR